MIPLGMVGLVQVTRTVLLLISIIALMTGGLGAVDNDNHYLLLLAKCITINSCY